MYKSVPKCTLSVQKCTKVYQSVCKLHVKCTKVYQSAPKVYKSVQMFTKVDNGIVISQWNCNTQWTYTLVHFGSLNVHFGTLWYIFVHFCTFLYTLCILFEHFCTLVEYIYNEKVRILYYSLGHVPVNNGGSYLCSM